MNDLISRQAAIDAVEKESRVDGAYGYMDTKSIVDLLNNLPAAQPKYEELTPEETASEIASGEYNVCPVLPRCHDTAKTNGVCNMQKKDKR